MKKFYFFIALWILFYSLTCPVDQKPEVPVSIKRLYAHVHELTSIEPPRSYRNLSSLDRAAAYIFNELGKCSSRVEIQKYKVENNEYKNIIASFGPERGERIVVGAHYDVCGEQPGADDNASGVASILELARLFSALKPCLKQRIDLVAYSLEEPPFFRTQYMGSAVHAKSLAKANVKLRVMISLDMVGYFSRNASPHRFVSCFIKPGTVVPGNTTCIIGKKGEKKIAGTIKKYMMEDPEGIVVVVLNPSEDTPGIDWSDHLNYWNCGYPAVFISNFFVSPNPNYHQPADTINTLDFGKMAQIVKGIYRALTEL